ncbi:MerR family DNA-binding transcriptional regulator [Mangrovicoccus sp. HB161399]|uniref:MerR family transcriptional regulator n=1 Tax=Mangrovicoccus sp. HB161399 TaxID=2720392 RepID=UPI001553500B|nr:MerR family DNA-binding transcriptional regulator [Mangrovicoccus sp. HB161399]
MTQEETMTIRAMCDAFGVTARALRFYESKELLGPIRIGQKRLYTKRDRARLKLILRGKRFGFSLEEIRQLLDLYDPNDRHGIQMREAMRLGRVHLAEMTEQRDALNQAINDLQQQLDWGEEQIADLGKTEAA